MVLTNGTFDFNIACGLVSLIYIGIGGEPLAALVTN
jgi:hypothetical protein